MLKAGLGEVAEQREAALAHLGHEVLHRLEQQLHQVGGLDERLDVRSEALGQTGEEVQRHDHKVLVRRVHLLRVLLVGLPRGQGGGGSVRDKMVRSKYEHGVNFKPHKSLLNHS